MNSPVPAGKAPRVSVIIPAFNYARFLPRALDAVLSQTFTDHEIIVVDDGSTDDTPSVAGRYTGLIRYIRKANEGVSAARNTGVTLSRGELIAFLDADDAWREDKLAAQVAFMDENPSFAMSYTDMSHWVDGVLEHASYLHERGYRQTASGSIFRNLLHECFIFVPTVMVRRACLDRVGQFDPSLRNAEDLDLWLRIAAAFPIGFLDEPLTMRHAHGGGATSNRRNYHEGRIVVLKKVLTAPPDELSRGIARRKLAQAFWQLGYHSFTEGDMSGCRANMLRSMRDPACLGSALKYVLLSCIPDAGRAMLRLATRRPAAKR